MTRTCPKCHGSGEREYERVIRTLSGRHIVSRDPQDTITYVCHQCGGSGTVYVELDEVLMRGEGRR